MDLARNCRTVKLLGKAAAEKLAKSRILLLGVGGVGGYAAEFLVRSGVGEIVFVDGDVVEESNCNRQIVALSPTIGMLKAQVMAQRAAQINPQGIFRAECRRIAVENVPALLAEKFDLIADCIDDTPVKVALCLEALRRRIPVVSSMGAAGKCDPTQVERGDISVTRTCPLARVMRRKLKEHGVTSGIFTVFSSEKNVPHPANDASVPGSLAPVVAAFGAAVAAEALDRLLED